jgi:hypothetical protein
MAAFNGTGRRRIPRAVLFWLIFGLLNWSLGRVYLHRVLPRLRVGQIEQQFGDYRGQITTLAVGDSHMATGFDPRFFRGSFNFALNGETYIYNYYKLKHVLERSPGIRTVLLPLDLHSFSAWRADRELRDFYWVRYVNYLELAWISHEPLEYLSRYVRGRFFPYLGESADLLEKPRSDQKPRRVPRPELVQGFVIKTGTFDKNREAQALRRVNLHLSGHKVFDETAARYFRKILELCAAKGTTLVLIKFPVSKPYYRLAMKRVAALDLYRRADEMIKPYRNVRVLDFQESFFDRDSEWLDDPDHLNESGAKILTREIERLLAVPGSPEMR